MYLCRHNDCKNEENTTNCPFAHTPMPPPIRAAKDTNIDSLLLITEQHDRTRLISAANQLMAFYYKEETSDEPLRFNHHTPSDSIRMYTWYWTSEHYLTHHKYQQSICYSLFALPLCRKSKNQQLLSDCLSVAAIVPTRKVSNMLYRLYKSTDA